MEEVKGGGCGFSCSHAIEGCRLLYVVVVFEEEKVTLG